MNTFRKNNKGEWVVFGTASDVRVGKVLVERKDGSKRTVEVASVGTPFRANGQMMVYGYIAPKGAKPAPAPVAVDREVEEERETEMDAEIAAERQMALDEAGFGRSYDAADAY